jgi:hypothetical protein
MTIKVELIKILYRIIDRFHLYAIAGKWKLTGTLKSGTKFDDLDQLIETHFTLHSEPAHICRQTPTVALRLLGGRAATIVETGSSAWGSNSSLLFDAYVRSYGGTFETVDIRVAPSVAIQNRCSPSTNLYRDDSVSFLKKWNEANPNKKIDLLYLDSWDVSWQTPNPSALHGLAELLAVFKNLNAGSLLLVDDTPVDPSYFLSAQVQIADFKRYQEIYNFTPGKGALIKLLLNHLGRGKQIAHRYQLLWQF